MGWIVERTNRIEVRIHKARADFIVRTGIIPNLLFLGLDEARELGEWANVCWMNYMNGDMPSCEGIVYMGMKVQVGQEDRLLGVGLTADQS